MPALTEIKNSGLKRVFWYNEAIMKRRPESQELMDDVKQAEAYATSDFTEAHNSFVAYIKEVFPNFSKGLVLDVGCGNADPTVRFAKAFPETKIVAIDGSEPMIRLGREFVEQEGLSDRISLEVQMIQDMNFVPSTYDGLICNSLLHHLEYPQDLWALAKTAVKPNGYIFVMDLVRPLTEKNAQELVDMHTEGAPELMRKDFFASLLAAFRPEEVKKQLDEAGLRNFHVDTVSDRHMIIYGINTVTP